MKYFAKHLLTIFLCIGMVGCYGFSICENTPEQVVVSPNGELKAVIFDRGCGATTGFVTGISILDSAENLSNADKGNVLLAEGAYQEPSSSTGRTSGVNFEVEWITDTKLRVRHSIPNVKQSDNVGNIRIRYEWKYSE